MSISPLADLHRARGARMIEYQGWEIPGEFSSCAQEYRALESGAGLVDLSMRGKMRVVGPDRRRWLHGMVTQEVIGLADGRGAYAAVLNPQGHMLSDMRIFALPEVLLCDLPPATAESIPEHLDRYLIMEKARIEVVTDQLALLSLQGPQSGLAVSACLGAEWGELPVWGVGSRRWDGVDLVVARVSHCGVDGYDLFVDAARAVPLYTALCAHRQQFAVDPVGWQAINHRRIEAGIPWWGHELDLSVVPYEARLEAAISLTKGCYVGQEIIARLEARGQVNNLLCGLTLEGDRVPEPKEEIFAGDGRKIGRITSAVRSPASGGVIALGYLRREHSAPGTSVTLQHAQGEQSATVAALPFIPNAW
jgi:folate-binding protein YgfZ